MSAHSEDLDALRERVERDPGGVEFPAFADALRRAGDPEAALTVAERGLDHAGDNVAGRVARALALLALGRDGDARGALEGVLETVPGWLSDEALAEPSPDAAPEPSLEVDAAIEDDELDAAFAGAETRAEEMVSANDIAERAMEEVEGPVFTAERHPTFATETMAGLLERQGDVDSAQAIRESIQDESGRDDFGFAVPPSADDPMDDSIARPYGTRRAEPLVAEPVDAAEVPASAEFAEEPRASQRAATLVTLERWLANIQRGVR